MPTCLDDINVNLASMATSLAGLADPTLLEWSAAEHISVLQSSVPAFSSTQWRGISIDGTFCIVNARITLIDAAGPGVILLPGLSGPAIDGGQTGSGMLIDVSTGIHYHGAVIWYSDGWARLMVSGSNNWLGATPAISLGAGDVITLNLSYRLGG
jgi:hypothetical protein